MVVKGKIAFENSPGYQAQIDELRLKGWREGQNSKIKTTGRKYWDKAGPFVTPPASRNFLMTRMTTSVTRFG
jgi:hypothetical protein